MKTTSSIRIIFLTLSFAFIAVVLFSCSPETKRQFSSLGSSILNAAGVHVTESQFSNFVDAGEKLNAANRGLSNEQEFFLGRAVAASILQKYPLIHNTQELRYVNKVGKILSNYSPRPETFSGYHFGVLDSQEINALSAPSGFVFLTKGFIDRIGDEDSLAAILAHEIAHVALGHGTAAISQSNITSALTVLGKDAASYSGSTMAQELIGPFSNSVSEVVQTLLVKGYSRNQEYEADLMAANILAKSGYQQGAIVIVLKSLESISGQGGGWSDTHPKPEKRINELNDQLKIAEVDEKALGYQSRKARFTKNIK